MSLTRKLEPREAGIMSITFSTVALLGIAAFAIAGIKLALALSLAGVLGLLYGGMCVQQNGDATDRNLGMAGIGLSLAALTFAAIAFVSHSENESEERNTSPSRSKTGNGEKGAAGYWAKLHVKERLKAPSTAEFPSLLDGWSDHISILGEGRYQIRSWILRTPWVRSSAQISLS